ncbi:hypothetical protein [Saccharomonospora sp.]|uniref:hypothetical protein n=1 Tax=Saccharomonospora sp. TaxID=33913 RepID=UPI00260997BE|nr:hypothetical protein [Saccharomonospora sp.]
MVAVTVNVGGRIWVADGHDEGARVDHFRADGARFAFEANASRRTSTVDAPAHRTPTTGEEP